MKIQRACAVGLAVLAAWAGTASAQPASYPNQTIKLLVGWTAGGATDLLARQLATHMAKQLEQPVVVDNRAGAVGTIAHSEASRAKPDGYTLILATNSTYAIAPHLIKPLSYGPDALAPIALVGTSPLILTVKPTLNVQSVKEVIDLARQQPGRLNYSSGGNGSTSHLASELFKDLTRTSITHIPYKGGGPATLAVASGEVDLGFVDIGVAVPMIRAGRLKAVAVSGSARSPVLPQVPTVEEAGVPRFESATKFALFAPAGTPPAVIERLAEAVRSVQKNDELKDRLRQQGIELVATGPAELRKDAADDLAKWGRLIRERKLSLD
ncbi:MAG: tripartite tricarboxylate transporter substrate binding protein [Hydrogenophaga sp.]|uniref:Bug family tripartite tricarboxylate transporter substrate binding protein n=1 Tax=Hydrogenophaga sp. TaxID=1904254 RepID=UPI001D52CDD7|nr:tripartite tricarboxylate transporter substrate binding protein [Hydrogenophaga sp.]MBW0169462.1 tripartite tricarboxylate transporter substrate binding protein [Hydrogenophaga sp.]MBW0182910.1 tripartite tricarboxylate transporter substrate binding protein [Hydrogenophaga sp.]